MKYLLLITAFISLKTHSIAQIEPGTYEVINLNYFEPYLSLDSLGENGNSTFTSYLSGGNCITLKITSCWEVNDSILSYYSQKLIQRSNCEEEFMKEEIIEDYSYKITEIGTDYFIGESIDAPGTRMKWEKFVRKN